MSPYIYCRRANGVTSIDLVPDRHLHEPPTNGPASRLRALQAFFVRRAPRKQASEVIALEGPAGGALREPALAGGSGSTNWSTMRGPHRSLKDLERMESSGAIRQCAPERSPVPAAANVESVAEVSGRSSRNMRRLPDW